jgi:lipoic acid synthetase
VPGGELSQRIPRWLKADLPDANALGQVVPTISSLKLNTICFEARCPNKDECFSSRCVTFLILGSRCSRRCRFCNVTAGRPEPVDRTEPHRIVEACFRLGLKHIVITSVTRDDLPDGGSGQFIQCIRLLRQISNAPSIEVLVPDFGGNRESVEALAATGPDVFAHNLETVERLYPVVRDRADYMRSLDILGWVGSEFPEVITKSGLILGMGETMEEVKSVLRDLYRVGCDIVTVGQYMRPSKAHLPVREYVNPVAFGELCSYGRELGLIALCGPKVRSSYLSEAAFREAKLRRQKCA